MSYKLKETLLLFSLGMLGVLTILTMPLPSLPEEVLQQFSETTLRLLSMIQPAVLLILAAFSGAYLGDKVGLNAPFLEGIIRGAYKTDILTRQLLIGIPLGFIAGVIIVLATDSMQAFLPESFSKMQEEMSISMATRFLYGGITEEVLMRWGLMSFLVWLGWQISKRQVSWIYWGGIIVTAFLFGLGHLPVLFMSVETITPLLVTYIIVANMFFGIIAGWLFWKYGLETAIVAHVFAHVGMIFLGG
jgi:membrane protease YdiL (CAAX protease family)